MIDLALNENYGKNQVMLNFNLSEYNFDKLSLKWIKKEEYKQIIHLLPQNKRKPWMFG